MKENFLILYRVRGILPALKEQNSKCHGFYNHWHSGAWMAQRQSRFQHSPVTINLIHTSGSILTPMLNTIIDIYTAVLTRPTGCTGAGVAAGIIQHTASSVGTWLLIEDRAVRYTCHEIGDMLLHAQKWNHFISYGNILDWTEPILDKNITIVLQCNSFSSLAPGCLKMSVITATWHTHEYWFKLYTGFTQYSMCMQHLHHVLQDKINGHWGLNLPSVPCNKTDTPASWYMCIYSQGGNKGAEEELACAKVYNAHIMTFL